MRLRIRAGLCKKDAAHNVSMGLAGVPLFSYLCGAQL